MTATTAWRDALRHLEVILERTSTKFNVLRQIDRSISNTNLQFDQLIHGAADLLCEAYKIDSFGIFYGIDDLLIPVRDDHGKFNRKLALAKYISLRKKSRKTSNIPKISFLNDETHFMIIFPFMHGSVVILIVELPKNQSDIVDFKEFSANFAEQISSFTQYVLYRRKREAQRVAYEAFFDNRLQPSACWNALLGTLDLFLPDQRFAHSEVPPLRQLLTYVEGDTVMRLAAGEGSHTSSFVLVDESISGLVIKDRSANWFQINPQTRPDLYKGYGRKNSLTELVIRLDADGSVVGIINIEHERENAFNPVFVACMREAAEFLAPLVAGLQARYDSFRKKEIGLLYIFTDMLARMGDTYGHLVSQPMLTARGAIAEIRYIVENEIGATRQNLLIQELGSLSKSIDEIEAHSDEFTEGLPEFISYGSQSISIRIDRRLRSFKKLAQAEQIEIKIEENEDTLCAYASSLFQEHIYNIVNNSYQQIRKRIFEGKVRSGLIAIKIKRSEGKTPRAQTTGLDFIEVIISDNGGGASKADLKKIGRPGFTTKREYGSGFGVAAAKEYFESIGGEMTWGNIRGGFQTIIRMQEFKPGIHSEARFIDRIRAEAIK